MTCTSFNSRCLASCRPSRIPDLTKSQWWQDLGNTVLHFCAAVVNLLHQSQMMSSEHWDFTKLHEFFQNATYVDSLPKFWARSSTALTSNFTSSRSLLCRDSETLHIKRMWKYFQRCHIPTMYNVSVFGAKAFQCVIFSSVATGDAHSCKT